MSVKCPECGTELDELHVECNALARIWIGDDGKMKKIVVHHDGIVPDGPVTCPSCDAELDLDVPDIPVMIE